MGVRNGLYFGSMYTDGLNLLFFFELDGERLCCKCHESKVDGKVRSYLVKDNPTVSRKLVGRTALLLKVG